MGAMVGGAATIDGRTEESNIKNIDALGARNGRGAATIDGRAEESRSNRSGLKFLFFLKSGSFLPHGAGGRAGQAPRKGAWRAARGLLQGCFRAASGALRPAPGRLWPAPPPSPTRSPRAPPLPQSSFPMHGLVVRKIALPLRSLTVYSCFYSVSCPRWECINTP